MQLPFITRKPRLVYSQAEIADQLGDLSDLIIKREKSLQFAILEKSDTKQQKRLEEVANYDELIDIKQAILKQMLSKNLKRVSKD
jgi:hypothetical protein